MKFRFEHEWIVDFLDTTTKLPVSRQWRFPSADVIKSLVSKSKTRLNGPREKFFHIALESGKGELLLEITGEQFVSLQRRSLDFYMGIKDRNCTTPNEESMLRPAPDALMSIGVPEAP